PHRSSSRPSLALVHLPPFPPFLFSAPATTDLYPLSLHDALPIFRQAPTQEPGYKWCVRASRSAYSARCARYCRCVPGVHRQYRRSEEHTSELQSRENLVCRLLLEKKKQQQHNQQDIHIMPLVSDQ